MEKYCFACGAKYVKISDEPFRYDSNNGEPFFEWGCPNAKAEYASLSFWSSLLEDLLPQPKMRKHHLPLWRYCEIGK